MPRIAAGVLDIAYSDVGPVDGPVAILLHGFPYDVRSYDQIATHLANSGIRCVIPELRGYGATNFLSHETFRSGQQGALASDLIAMMDALKISKAVLAGYDWGGRAACIVAALRPERVLGLVSCGTGYNIQDLRNPERPIAPDQEHRFWYQYYFHSERGRAGLTRNRSDLCRLLWKLWSPSWDFNQTTFDQTAVSFTNPDFVDVVVHSYRHRFGLVAGDPRYQDIERELLRQPTISVPTIVLQGQDDGVDPPTRAGELGAKFTGEYEYRLLPGVGHNVPQEAPYEFSASVVNLLKIS
ncbi:alpha/beta fold hydrolase [Agrobacterium sp. NPDC090273]|uniref:alpha/beta fold hydrolase n=1 Tax=Agrobacterium sp. NPDC090273 TaxID=3363919 RepID=UPI00383A3DD1